MFKKTAFSFTLLYFSFLFLIIEKTLAQQIQFAKNYSIGNYNIAHVFIQLNDSGFIIAGSYGSSNNNRHGILIRIDKFGDTLWTKKCLWAVDFYSIQANSDSTFIITGVRPPITLWQFSINADSLWSKSYDTLSTGDYSLRIYKTADNGYILTNAATNYGFLKLDSAFNEQWHHYQNMYYGGTLYPDVDGGFIGGGGCGFLDTPYQVQKRDTSGAILWDYCYGNIPGNMTNYWADDILILSDSSYLVACRGTDWQLMKVNRNNGDTLWTKSYYPLTNSQIFCMDYYSNNRYLLGGSNVVTLVNENGDSIWNRIKPFSQHISLDIHPTSDGGFAHCGYSVGTAPQQQYLSFVKYDSLGNTIFTSIFNPENNLQPLSFYPNPTQNQLYINPGNMTEERSLQFTFYDLQGKIMLQQICDFAQPININTMPEGLYIAVLKGKEKEVRAKVMIQR